MLIRKMTQDDVDQVADFAAFLFSDAWSKEAFSESLKCQQAHFLVAVDRDEILGYCGCYYAADEAEIVSVGVKKTQQNQGIGKKIIQESLENAVQDGIRFFILEVRKSNQTARHVYQTLGFLEAGIRKGFYDKPIEDAVVMTMEYVSTDN